MKNLQDKMLQHHIHLFVSGVTGVLVNGVGIANSVLDALEGELLELLPVMPLSASPRVLYSAKNNYF
jgi:hypothetical protein